MMDFLYDSHKVDIKTVVSTVWAEETGISAQNAATILKPLVPNPHSAPSTHDATC